MTQANPVLVEVTRGDMVESRHRGSVAVVDARGKVVMAIGDISSPVYARSSAKPLQALPFVESGAADAFGFGDVEIALSCASHNGEAEHVAKVSEMLARVGLSGDALECGVQLPDKEVAFRPLIENGVTPRAVHNNCSGKHAGFLSTAVHLEDNPAGYIGPDHPVMERVTAAMRDMTGESFGSSPCGFDGCGIPVIGASLTGWAQGMARMAAPDGLAPARAEAAKRIVRAMTEEPFYVAGRGRFCTQVMKIVREKAAIKTGAEGVYAGILPGLGLGVALKIDDGGTRAAEVAMGAVMVHLGVVSGEHLDRLTDILTPPIHNRNGVLCGHTRAAEGWLDG